MFSVTANSMTLNTRESQLPMLSPDGHPLSSTWVSQLTQEKLNQANKLASLQMSELEEIDSALRGEYTVRRRMLIERAKVTLQSFLWAERLQKEAGKRQPAEAAAQQGEALMHDQPAVSLHDVFKAKQGQSAYL
jgi:hypothetical protein